MARASRPSRPWMALRGLRRVPAALRASSSIVGLAWRAQPHCLAGLLLVKLAEGLLPVGAVWLSKLLFDGVAQALKSGASGLPPGLLPILLAHVLLAALLQLGPPLSGYLSGELARRLTLLVQSTAYRKINSLAGLAPFEDPRFHDTLELGVQGAQMGPSQAVSLLSGLLAALASIAGFMGVLLAFSPLLAGLVALAILPQLVAQIKLGRQRFDLAFEQSPRMRQAGYYGMLLSAASFAKELRLFGLGEHILSLFVRNHEQVYAAQRQQQRRELRWESALALLGSVVGGLCFVLVVLQALAGGLSIGDVLLYLGTIAALQTALGGLVYALASLSECLLFQTRYQALLALPEPLERLLPTRPVPPLRSGIELRDVWFRYSPEHPWVLRQLSLHIPAGECLALVGLNGAGKSTLVKLLTRCYDPCQGQILWDGVDIRQLDPGELRQRIAAIFQDFTCYELSAYDNIALGNIARRGEQETVRAAARAAGVEATIEALPRGYQTTLSRWLSEDGQGVELSGGQWQKIALARMFMRPADLLLLDEPSAALDAEAERELSSRLFELVAGRSALLISHRLSSVRHAHAIAVLEDGTLVEHGSHAELLERGGLYARLYRTQAAQYGEEAQPPLARVLDEGAAAIGQQPSTNAPSAQTSLEPQALACGYQPYRPLNRSQNS